MQLEITQFQTNPSNSTSISSAMASVKARRIMLTAAVAIITATGAYAGAVWKTDSEQKQVRDRILQKAMVSPRLLTIYRQSRK